MRASARSASSRLPSFAPSAPALWYPALLRLLRILALLRADLRLAGLCAWPIPWTIGVGTALLDHVIDPLATLGREFLDAIPKLIFLVILYFIVRFGLRMVRLFFESVERGIVKLGNFEPEWAMPTYKIVRLAIIVLGLVVAYPVLFRGPTPRPSRAYRCSWASCSRSVRRRRFPQHHRRVHDDVPARAFRVGDRVKIGDVVGDVTAMRLQVTHLRTTKNEEVVIPNSQIINGHVINYTTLARKEGLLLHTTVGIGYETPWRQVEAMLLERRAARLGLRPSRRPLRAADARSAISPSPTSSTSAATDPHPDGATLFGAAPEHPRCLQRVRRRDHDAGLRSATRRNRRSCQRRNGYLSPAKPDHA